jgi:hypothetical protein
MPNARLPPVKTAGPTIVGVTHRPATDMLCMSPTSDTQNTYTQSLGHRIHITHDVSTGGVSSGATAAAGCSSRRNVSQPTCLHKPDPDTGRAVYTCMCLVQARSSLPTCCCVMTTKGSHHGTAVPSMSQLVHTTHIQGSCTNMTRPMQGHATGHSRTLQPKGCTPVCCLAT